MIFSIDLLQIPPKFRRLVGLISLMCLLPAAFPGGAFSGDDLLPPQLDDLKLGVSSGQIIEKMKDFGTPERSALKRPKRFMLSWALKTNPYFKKAEFEFTEKDHLYLARFILQDAYRFKTKGLKKRMFTRFGVAWENPGKMRTKEKDITLYIPLPGKKVPFFFDMTNTITGQKWFELFDKNLSARDRKGTKSKSSKEKTLEKAKDGGSENANAIKAAPPKEAKPAKEEPAESETK
jgi:hypothetical protein